MSCISIGFGNDEQSDTSKSGPRQSIDNDKFRKRTIAQSSAAWFKDTVGVVLVCSAHRKLALGLLRDHPSNNIWFPVKAHSPDDSYDETAVSLLTELLATHSTKQQYSNPQLVHTLRLEVPRCGEVVTRVLFFVDLNSPGAASPNKTCACSPPQATSTTQAHSSLATWHRFEDVLKLPYLHGPEPAIIAGHRLASGNIDFPSTFSSYYQLTMRQVSTAVSSGPHAELFHKSGTDLNDAIEAYSEFVQHCFPSAFMNTLTFAQYINRVLPDLHKELDIGSLAYSFETTRTKQHIDFMEFLAGLAALSRSTPHGDNCGRVRVSYIFRYYNTSGGEGLNIEEMTNFATDLLRLRSGGGGIDPSEESVTTLVGAMYVCFKIQPNKPVPYQAFARAIGSVRHNELRGTSNLFRSEVHPMDKIKEHRLYMPLVAKPNAKSTCDRCRPANYTITSHYITTLINGVVCDPVLLAVMPDFYQKPAAVREHSAKIFSKVALANQMMDMISQYYEYKVAKNDDDGGPKTSEWDNAAKRHLLVTPIKKLCAEVTNLLTSEPRVLRLQSPCNVIGDLHGSISDLMNFELELWRMGASCLTANYLFLGNLVDKGEHSVECVLYLFSLKLMAPTQFHLLRGNHELRDVQREIAATSKITKAKTFLAECNDKFGQGNGKVVWEAINNAFDCLPVAALIDEQIFAVHGGIPSTMSNLGRLKNIVPCPLRDPLKECPVVWELLWNDPISGPEFDKEKNEKTYNTKLPAGFLPNGKRTTGHYWNDSATEAFLKDNSLSHVIRGHELVPNGFAFHAGGKVITVFSCSNCLGKGNAAAVLQVGMDNKIRPIKVES